LLYTGGDDPQIVKKYSTKWVRVLRSVVDLPLAMADADFAILNGTHATTIAALLAGKPTLHFPLFLEQWLFATRVWELNAGQLVGANNAIALGESLERMAAGEGNLGAPRFAAKHAGRDPQAAVTRIIEAIEAAIAGSAQGALATVSQYRDLAFTALAKTA
jgi:UDP:flavonoid glycosyltransferase YjiC (YdhE family)